jgi:hypothetical protein
VTAVAPIEMEFPAQIAVFAITEAAGNGLMFMVTELDFKHPFIFVSVNVYELVDVGDTIGFETVELNPEIELVHLYRLPATAVVPIEIELPMQIAVLAITDAAGKGLTVMVTESDFTHPFEFVSVKVYELLDVGLTVGFAAVEL